MLEFEAAAAEIAHRLTSRHETIAVAESSAGGLISAALLAVSFGRVGLDPLFRVSVGDREGDCS